MVSVTALWVYYIGPSSLHIIVMQMSYAHKKHSKSLDMHLTLINQHKIFGLAVVKK